jgi:hypothetical protein
MSTPEFLREFKALHEKAKRGSLAPAERARYDALRPQFDRMVMIAQQLGHAGRTLRATLRMAKLLKVEIRPDGGEPVRASTIDLASGGFASLLPAGMRVGAGADFTLFLPAGAGRTTPIVGRVTVASSRPQTGAFRVSFKFEPLEREAKELLDVTLIDAVLERFGEMP